MAKNETGAQLGILYKDPPGPLLDHKRSELSSLRKLENLTQQRFCVFQVSSIKTLSKPFIDWGKQFSGVFFLALAVP